MRECENCNKELADEEKGLFCYICEHFLDQMRYYHQRVNFFKQALKERKEVIENEKAH